MADVQTPVAPSTEGTTNIKDAKEVAKETAKEAAEAYNLLAQGKRNMLCNEIPQAVNQLQDACRLLAKKYGETADECAEAYLCYGTALLDLSRMESGVLGNALQGIESEDDESASDDKIEDPTKLSEKEKGEISDQVIDAMMEDRPEKKEQNGDAKAKQNGHTENGDAKAKQNGHTENGVNGHVNGDKAESKEGEKDKDEAMETEDSKAKKDEEEGDTEEGDTAEEGEEGDTAEEGDEGEECESIEDDKEGTEGEKTEGDAAAEGEAGSSKGKKEEEEEDVSNLQLAWEMLELAKVIYARHESKEMKLKTADAYLKLGEVGLETEQYEQAVGDFKACLKIQKAHLEAESRLVAETHYQIGLACCFNQTYPESIEHLETAVKVINTKIEKLEKVIAEKEPVGKGKEVSACDDPATQAQKEIKDLKEILPDILAKIEDTKEEMQSQDKVKKMLKENVATVATEFGSSTGFSSSSTTDNVATVDSSLVRKKRKTDDETANPDEKKARQEDGAGDADKTKASS